MALAVAAWRHAEMLAEVLGEGALIREAAFLRDVADEAITFLKQLAGGLDAYFEQEELGAGAEDFDEFPMELPWREVHSRSEFADGEAFAESSADDCDGLVDGEQRLVAAAAEAVALCDAEDADDAAAAVAHGELVGDEPVGDSLGIEEELDDIQLRATGADDFGVVLLKVLGEACGEEGEIVLADEGAFAAQPQALVEMAVRSDEARAPILRKKGDTGYEIEKAVIRLLRCEGAEEPVMGCRLLAGGGCGFHAGGRFPTKFVRWESRRQRLSVMTVESLPMQMTRSLPLAILVAALSVPVLPVSVSAAEPRPLRVLFYDAKGAEQTKAGVLRLAAEQLGRDAIYFDWFGPASGLDEKTAASYDMALVSGDGDQPALAALRAKKRVVAVKDGEAPAAIRSTVLATVDAAAKSDWEKFLVQREAERREKHPNVANYEKRAEAVTFQHPFSVKGAMERTQVPADCRLEVFASEPQIGKPIAFAWDARGRLWVAETADYPHGVVESGEGGDSIKICEDTDGDGRADKFTVFAEKLNIPTGIVFARGGVIVAQPPRLLFLKDTNGDDRADLREVIIDGWGIRDTHAQASNLHLGHDNWLYGCVGYSGFKGTVGGKPFEFAMGTYRFRPDGSALEFLHQFTNNSWGHSANDAGDQFGGTANNAPIFYGGIPATAFPVGMRGMTAKKINVVDQARAITPNYRQVDVFGSDADGAHWGGFTAAAGSSFIESPVLPARMQGKAMVCEPTMKLVNLMDVQPDGAGWKALDAMPIFASSDEWTSPVYAEVGPDGAVWIADWQNFIIQHNPTPSVGRGGYDAKTGVGGAHENPLRDHGRGRIYRIVAKDTPARMPRPLAGASTAEVVAALNAGTQYWRLLAQQILVEGKKTDATPALKQMVTANDGATGAIHALWSLHGLGTVDGPTHQAALLAKDARLRRNAVRALGNDAASQSLFFGSGVVSDPSPHTRLAALVKLADFPTTDEIKTLAGRIAADSSVQGDEWLREAARLLVKKHGAAAFKEGPNLLVNGDLEKIGADGLPEGWKRRDYGRKPGNAGAEWKVVADAHSGKTALRCASRDDADTSFFQDVPLKPGATYRLSGWVKTRGLRGKVSFNDHIGRSETNKLTAREAGWTEVEILFTNKDKDRASINILHVAKGDGFFDDVKLAEVTPLAASEEKLLAGDAPRGEAIFWKHPVAACVNCHMLAGKGSTVGPALDGIAARKDAAYLRDSLVEPNKVLAEGFEKLGVSPMPPMPLILKPQELADVEAFLRTLK